jgi:hypothetical protein
METKSVFLKISFADFYGNGYSPKEYTGPEYTQTLTLNENYVCVRDSVFQYCLSSSNGGAIYCSNTVYKLLVERTSFISCKTSSSGGGICFYNTASGECILSKICGFNCSSTGSGQCANIYTKNDATFKNHVNDSSFSHTSKVSSSPHHVLYLNYGNILCPSVNITNNECYGHTAIWCSQSVSSSSDTICISYSSIVNNTANGGWGCLNLNKPGSSQLIDTCNILNNKQTVSSTYDFMFYTNANLLIKDSCVLGNNEGKLVFHAPSGSVTLSNCTIDDDIISKKKIYWKCRSQ